MLDEQDEQRIREIVREEIDKAFHKRSFPVKHFDVTPSKPITYAIGSPMPDETPTPDRPSSSVSS